MEVISALLPVYVYFTVTVTLAKVLEFALNTISCESEPVLVAANTLEQGANDVKSKAATNVNAIRRLNNFFIVRLLS
ncbi:hypothetical protein Cphy_2929 [Lachnoclostridium phytofermentans ISDg]|uniref:Uncharacterized protein n=1 Tax=Lachnoclostridium phytofermentans (strain ATCC 700394 / DSM 18823 / ISDg) TaxID=357809 RepID=A9KPL2_LACP7|nr:hypothetical protein Cphy_2929 [Lachnoclostridium phytofermentans ISDg]